MLKPYSYANAKSQGGNESLDFASQVSSFRIFFLFLWQLCYFRVLVEAQNVPKNTMSDFVAIKRVLWSTLMRSICSKFHEKRKLLVRYGGGGSPYTQDVWINTYITLAVQMQQAGWHWLTSEQTLLNKEEWTEELNWWGSVSSCRPVWYQEENVSKWPRITRFKKEHAGDLPPDRVSWVQKFLLNISGIPKLPRPCLGNSLPTTLLLNSHCHITWKVKRIG